VTTTTGRSAAATVAQVRPATVRTKPYLLAQRVARTALEQSKMAGFFGQPGTGKTVAISDFCATAAIPSAYITAAASPQRKEIYEEILLATTGAIPKDKTARELRRECEAVLRESPWIVVVDECQNLRNMWHQQLRSLHDAAHFCLLVVGGTNAVTTLKRDGQLWSRVKLRMWFEALEGDELIGVLHKMHPILANTERDLLEEIDRRDCRGNLRNWGAILDLALPLVIKTITPDRLSPKVIQATFALRGVS
jgi:DNA transposition AAA+ family ATPase